MVICTSTWNRLGKLGGIVYPIFVAPMSLKNLLPVHSGNPSSSATKKHLPLTRTHLITIIVVSFLLWSCVFPERTLVDLLSQDFLGQETSKHSTILIQARKGAVASQHKLCSEMGVDVLKHGGNAVDAAVSTVLCIGVVSMYS